VVIDPRNAWRLAPGAAEFERQWLWLCHDVDSNWARISSRGQTVNPLATPAVPDYFTINGFAGFQSLAVTTDLEFNERRHEDTLPSGHPRETDVRNFSASPSAGAIRTGHLMRMLNAGIVDHQLHYHGNHVWTVRSNGLDFPRSNGRVTPKGDVVLQQWEDTIQLQPLDHKESILPVRRPPEGRPGVERQDRGLDVSHALPRGTVPDGARRAVPRRAGGGLGAGRPARPGAKGHRPRPRTRTTRSAARWTSPPTSPTRAARKPSFR
jgi:hypothetical protein